MARIVKSDRICSSCTSNSAQTILLYLQMKSTTHLHMLSLLLQLLFFHPSNCIIYLEEINDAIFYDSNEEMSLPDHILSHQEVVITASDPIDSAPNVSAPPSSAPSSNSSNIFDRHLSSFYIDTAPSRGFKDTSHSIAPFNDLKYIQSSSNYIYYDSKQARFGMDLGPRGNFEVGNLILPPRGLWGSLPVEDDDYGEVMDEQSHLDESKLVANSTASMSLNQAVFNQTHNSSIASVANETGKRRLRNRYMESIDVFLGLAEPSSSESENKTSTLQASSVADEKVTSIDNATSNQTDDLSVKDNETSIYNATLDNQMYISDYFCLEDFVEWKMKLQECNQQQREQQLEENQDVNATHFLRGGANESFVGYDNNSSYSNESEATSIPCISNNPSLSPFLGNQTYSNSTIPNPNYINSTRPITILALRGRCSFESKAQMAMLLNEIFTAHGKSNRIAHIIVYNNLTGHSEEDEELIDMGLASQTFQEYDSQSGHEDRYKVGMVYVNSNSGRDLIHRMMERGREIGLLPYLNVEGLFVQDDVNATDDLVDTSERVLDEAGGDGVEESTKGEYNNTIFNDKELVHDASITNGWFFPATLTKFCLSCGPDRNYGFDPPVPDVNVPQNEWGQGWYGGWSNYDNIYHPGERPVFDDKPEDPIIYDQYKGSYFYPEEWVEAVRKLMISVLAILLIGPFVFAAWRWRSVGGTVRLARDENGARHLRLIAPDMEVFVNGQSNSVERNGTKLDRAQVFALPEMEYVRVSEEGAVNESVDEAMPAHDTGDIMIAPAQAVPSHSALAQSPPTPSSSLGECLEAGVFVSSTCCSICIEEFEHREKLRILPRCSHAFHTGESSHHRSPCYILVLTDI